MTEAAARDADAGSDPATPDSRLFVNSLAKGLRVLGAFRNGPATMTIADIAVATRIGRSAAQRFVYTLERLGYLARDPATRAYRLTPRVLELGYGYLHHDPLLAHGARVLNEIARQSEEAATLTELDDLDVVVLYRVLSQHLFSLNVLQGMRFPAYCSAPGRAILAFVPPARATDVIARSRIEAITPHTITDRARLMATLDGVRSRGYSLAVDELFLGSLSVAVPVLGPDGEAPAAISVFCPTARWTPERASADLVPLLADKARELARAALF